jgi:hypothetical protein
MRFDQANDLLKPGYLPVESGVIDLEDGFKTVCALTRMPRARARMVEWWFGWLGGTEQYKLWHPTDHLFSDWEDRTGNTHVGSSHLVHEYLGGADGPVYKLRINFRDPSEFFDPAAYAALDGVAICARIGLLDAPVNLGLMTHCVRNTAQGCEMRSRFFLGHVESRDPDHPIPPEAARALRHENVTPELARRLHQHATEEMSYLSEIMPLLYRQVTGDMTL